MTHLSVSNRLFLKVAPRSHNFGTNHHTRYDPGTSADLWIDLAPCLWLCLAPPPYCWANHHISTIFANDPHPTTHAPPGQCQHLRGRRLFFLIPGGIDSG